RGKCSRLFHRLESGIGRGSAFSKGRTPGPSAHDRQGCSLPQESSQEDLSLNSNSVANVKPRGTKPPPKGATALKISPRTLYGLTQIFKLLADESRLKILLALAEDGE